MASQFVLNTDGGARGNPGPAGAAYVLRDPDGNIVASAGHFLGETTNNVAEYRALICGLRRALEDGATPLLVCADSELMVKQLTGHYRVKNEGLKPLFEEAVGLIRRLGEVRVKHVRRADNKDADALANEAMDARADVGDAGGHPDDGCGRETLFG